MAFRQLVHNWRKEYLRKKLPFEDFTLLSQNCLGGVIYSDYGLEFASPTVNMYIEGEHFARLCEDFGHYISIAPKPLEEVYEDPVDPSISYPLISVDDVILHCMHYASCAEAIEAWVRRSSRVNLNKVFVLANSWNLGQDPELVQRVCSGPYKAVCFTVGEFEEENCIPLGGGVPP